MKGDQMKKLVFGIVSACCIVQTCYAVKLKSYQEAVDLLSEGKNVTLVINFDKCTTSDNHDGKKLSGLSVLRLPTVTLIQHGKIIIREVIPTGKIGAFPDLGNVYQTATVIMNQNNQLDATLQVLDPVTYKEVLAPTEIACDLNKGFNLYS